jgi:hypothetical protein
MVYNVVGQIDPDLDRDHGSTTSGSPGPQQQHPASTVVAPLRKLFLDTTNADTNNQDARDQRARGFGLNYMVNSITGGNSSASVNANTKYAVLEGEDLASDSRSSPPVSPRTRRKAHLPSEISGSVFIPRARRCRSPATADSASKITRPSPSEPILRTASGRRLDLRHPTPDLQVLQGAYTGNIEHLERRAEQLSMTSSIDEAIKQLHDEQKRSDSRRSSILSSRSVSELARIPSNTSSIVEVNSAARTGGYSPAAYVRSSKGSLSGVTANGRGRSASKSSKLGIHTEPEMDGRALDPSVNMPSMGSSSMSPTSPAQTASIEEQVDESSTLTKPVVDLLESPPAEKVPATEESPKINEDMERTFTFASITYENPEEVFDGFDGIHVGPNPLPPPAVEQTTLSGSESVQVEDDMAQRRAASGSRLSLARPQSYADPSTGQQMVYYPAPVPMMLNLPQKLSKVPSSTAKDKRRSKALSSVPAGARESAIWLPDVLENEAERELGDDDEAQDQEYMPQHQRTSMGGRRLTQDLSHLPPQLRASAFFDLPAPGQLVELKDQSAVATLDSILDASAFAPVGAFTDHAFAGYLGAEVYGRPELGNNRSSTQLQDLPQKKRTSSFNLLLRGRRASTNELEETDKAKRRSTMSGVVESAQRSPIEDEDEDDSEDDGASRDSAPLNQSEGEEQESDGESDEGLLEEEMYHGPPTTLLAELQLRKQQAKQRTRPQAQAYPNGMHSTLLELDAVAQIQAKSRKKKRTILAWEDPDQVAQNMGEDDDEDVPLAMLYVKKAQLGDVNRPMGLMERRDMEDNEPLSQRRNRLHGRPPVTIRAATMKNLSRPLASEEEEEGETLAQRIRRLKEAGGTATGLPADSGLPSARPVSGDFAAEMMNQFGVDLLDTKEKGKEVEKSTTPALEEEETLGQRRKRLQAEREARAKEVGLPLGDASVQRPEYKPKRSMADILQAHPAAGAERVVSYEKPVGGLLGMHEKQSAIRASTLHNFDVPRFSGQGQRTASAEKLGGFKAGMYNDGQGGILPSAPAVQPPVPAQGFNMYNGSSIPFAQPTLGAFPLYNANQMMMPFANPYPMGLGMGYTQNHMQMNMGYMQGMQQPMNMNMNLQMGHPAQPLNQGQIDMVERWRQSVMQ